MKTFERKQAGIARRAFTLVELLVVISIIAILASILLPSAAKLRKAARGVQSQSNLRQIALAILSYANNNQGRTPATAGLSWNPNLQLIGSIGEVSAGASDLDPNGNLKSLTYASGAGRTDDGGKVYNPSTWTRKQIDQVLASYIPDPRIWFNPNVPVDVPAHLSIAPPVLGGTAAGQLTGGLTYTQLHGTYLYNQYTEHLMTGMAGKVLGGRPVDSAYNPSQAILVWDDPCCSYGPAIAGTDGTTTYTLLEPWFELPVAGGINVAYLDGHVGFQPVADLTQEDVDAAAAFNALPVLPASPVSGTKYRVGPQISYAGYGTSPVAGGANAWCCNSTIVDVTDSSGTVIAKAAQKNLEIGWIRPGAVTR